MAEMLADLLGNLLVEQLVELKVENLVDCWDLLMVALLVGWMDYQWAQPLVDAMVELKELNWVGRSVWLWAAETERLLAAE